ncbi:MAG: class I SAM-dependent methyltransferase [Bacilli bacterium]|nr:class I SAM-dependent methyltransferase [Bacilli bacterium]MBN2697166.1 class I SAM-dependent methyltransferase [Bacilli bacterium]
MPTSVDASMATLQKIAFANTYDRLFPVKPATLSFLTDNLPLGKILDVGCGSGSYMLELERRGYSTKGVDSDPEMVKIAKSKAKVMGLNAKFSTGDMLYLKYRNEFDGVVFIGNTLVHAESESAVATVIDNVHQALKTHGTLILQIINYDRVIDDNLDHLPIIRNEGIVFERIYKHLPDGKIEFVSLINVDGENVQHSVLLFPLRYAKLVEELNNAGFVDIVAHDGFSDRPFSITESLQLTITCHKR